MADTPPRRTVVAMHFQTLAKTMSGLSPEHLAGSIGFTDEHERDHSLERLSMFRHHVTACTDLMIVESE